MRSFDTSHLATLPRYDEDNGEGLSPPLEQAAPHGAPINLAGDKLSHIGINPDQTLPSEPTIRRTLARVDADELDGPDGRMDDCVAHRKDGIGRCREHRDGDLRAICDVHGGSVRGYRGSPTAPLRPGRLRSPRGWPC